MPVAGPPSDLGSAAEHLAHRSAEDLRPLVAFDDSVGVGIIRAVHARGVRVPDDRSVAGFDDFAVSAFVEPPLTTVAQDMPRVGSPRSRGRP
jgi:DNA-binding LacI/PurR family transcriptional regulator